MQESYLILHPRSYMILQELPCMIRQESYMILQEPPCMIGKNLTRTCKKLTSFLFLLRKIVHNLIDTNFYLMPDSCKVFA